MFKKATITNDDGERGQVGIGTLIVFIALVLVAAIAAGVLINTAGFLQSQAEQTGQESTDQVSNTLDVVSVVGQQDASGVDIINVTLAKGPGSGPIDLADAEAQLITPGGAYAIDNLNEGSAASILTDGDSTALTSVVGGSDTRLTDTGDRIELVLYLSASAGSLSGAGPLSAGSDAQLQITTQDGSQSIVEISVPTPLEVPTEL